ncbi:MAG TPA: protein kinase, partial [Blastocatellia bacterium]|nr:protein kinase [Blastocatellia bacterium]
MTINSGTRLSHYEIISPIGAGGMGEVYRARDTRLGREVAIKVLPAAFSQDADRLQRFEKEARATSALNHPNILTIYDIGTPSTESGGAPYIVAELLEGAELRAQLNEGAIAPRKAIDYAQQIVRGLAAAHEKGIVHRDLKPGNLFVTKDGRVKILDFGLAKLKPQAFAGGVNTEAPTAPLDAETESGVILGTVGYMSPEQVRGERVDHRSDIFSFGAILHEMLSGKRAFQRGTPVETMSAILNEELPELSDINEGIAQEMGRVVRHCLEKRPERRFQTASDLGFALDALSTPSWERLTASARALDPVAVTKRTGWRERIAWIGISVLALLVLALAVAYFKRPAVKVEAIRFSIPSPEKATSVYDPTISPDGSRLAFVATAEGKTTLWVRPLGSLAAQPLPGTEGASFPFWSPDNQFIGFFSQGKLKKIPLSGGPPTTLGDAPDGRGGTWSRDGVILFSPGWTTGVHRVSAAGGAATVVTTPDGSRQENGHYWPSFLPDKRHFLYFAYGSQPEEIGIYLASLDGRERQRLMPADSNAVYAASERGGFLLFVREETLLAQPFDAADGRLTGEPFRLADQVQANALSEEGVFSVSENGVLVYGASASSGGQQLGWFDRAGKPLGVIRFPGTDVYHALSPDEKRVAVSRLDLQTRNADIWLLDLERGTESRFTVNTATDLAPVWSPDGSRIVWNSNREGLANLYQKAATGSGQDELLLKADNWKTAEDWSGDGQFILYTENNPKTKGDLWILPLEGERKPFPYAQTPFNEEHGRFSPDSRWIAYTSDESGSYEVYIGAFPTPG